jgi:hypothetical protein
MGGRFQNRTCIIFGGIQERIPPTIQELPTTVTTQAAQTEKKFLKCHLRVHFYNCAEFIRVDSTETSDPQCELSMVEKQTQDYRVDREMTPVFQRLGNSSKMPSTVKAFNRIQEVAADAARKEKAKAKRPETEKKRRKR